MGLIWLMIPAYRQGLNPQIRAMMAIYDDVVGLESFMLKTGQISQHLTACQLDETALSPAPTLACPPVPEPKQVDYYHLSRTERARRVTSGLCLYCGSSGHFIKMCSTRPPCQTVSTLQVKPDISTKGSLE